VGLLFQRRWTAAVAATASLLGGFFSEQEFAGEFDPLAILAGVVAAELWYRAYKNPLWDARTRRVVLRLEAPRVGRRGVQQGADA
jgi:hypothetical protein